MAFLPGITGSFSTGAADNPTLAVMDAAFRSADADYIYVNCEVPAGLLVDAVAGARAMGWRGFNCSVPHKQTVIPLLDDLSESAALCHAVNCVVRLDSGWVGYNTDGAGFIASIEENRTVTGADVCVIGSGGAAHAITVEAALHGAARVHIAGRNNEAVERLVTLVDASTGAQALVVPWELPLRPPPEVDILVNATTVGMTPDDDEAIDLRWDQLPDAVLVADVVVNPADTRFLQHARAAGADVVDGRGMLVNQAAENIRLWTGLQVDTAVMRRAHDAALPDVDGQEERS